MRSGTVESDATESSRVASMSRVFVCVFWFGALLDHRIGLPGDRRGPRVGRVVAQHRGGGLHARDVNRDR